MGCVNEEGANKKNKPFLSVQNSLKILNSSNKFLNII